MTPCFLPQVRFSRAKLELKEKQYLELADALRQVSPKHPGIAEAEAAAAELREVRRKLDEQRRAHEERMKKEQKSECSLPSRDDATV